MDSYADLLGQGPMAMTAPAPAMPAQPFTQMTQPTPEYIQQAQRPPANPQELERRIDGWSRLASRLESDPALLNSIMMASGALMGPVGQGGGAASWGRALTVGTNAYEQGTDRAQARKMLAGRETRAEAGEKRAQELHPHQVNQARANVAGTEAQTVGTDIRNRIALATEADTIALSKNAVERANLALTREFNEEEVAALERDVRAIRAYAQRNTASRDVQRAAEQAEEALKAAKQNSEKTGLDLRLSRLTTEALERMTPEELQRVVKAKFTGQGGAGSAIVQQMEAWGGVYDGLKKIDAPEVKGMSKEQYVAGQLKAAKTEDAVKSLKMLKDAGVEDPEIIGGYEAIIRQGLAKRGADAMKQIPPAAVEYLKKNPSTAAAFDAKYGKGASERYLKAKQ